MTEEELKKEIEAIAKRVETAMGPVEKQLEKFKETRKENWCRFLIPPALVLLVWVIGSILLCSTQGTWGKIDGNAWATAVLRSVVLVAGIGAMTAVSLAALRREW